MVIHNINYDLHTTGKITNFITGSKVEDKIKHGLEHAGQNAKTKLETR